jgi:hypothetical protein
MACWQHQRYVTAAAAGNAAPLPTHLWSNQKAQRVSIYQVPWYLCVLFGLLQQPVFLLAHDAG